MNKSLDKMNHEELNLSITRFLTEFFMLNEAIGSEIQPDLPLIKAHSKVISDIAYTGHNLPRVLATGNDELMRQEISSCISGLEWVKKRNEIRFNDLISERIKEIVEFNFLSV